MVPSVCCCRSVRCRPSQFSQSLKMIVTGCVDRCEAKRLPPPMVVCNWRLATARDRLGEPTCGPRPFNSEGPARFRECELGQPFRCRRLGPCASRLRWLLVSQALRRSGGLVRRHCARGHGRVCRMTCQELGPDNWLTRPRSAKIRRQRCIATVWEVTLTDDRWITHEGKPNNGPIMECHCTWMCWKKQTGDSKTILAHISRQTPVSKLYVRNFALYQNSPLFKVSRQWQANLIGFCTCGRKMLYNDVGISVILSWMSHLMALDVSGPDWMFFGRPASVVFWQACCLLT